MGAPTLSTPLLTAAEFAVCISEKAESVACGLEAQFQQVKDPSEPAVSDMSTDTMKEHTLVPACETQLNNALSVLQRRQRLRGWNVPEPKCHTAYGPETSTPASDKFLRKCLTTSSAGSSPTSMDTFSRELYTERKTGPRLVLVLVEPEASLTILTSYF